MPRGNRRLRLAVAGSVATGLAGQTALMVSGPLLARMLGVDGRGQLAALVLWPTVIAQLGGLGLPLAVTYEIAHGPSGAARAKRAMLLFATPQAVTLSAVHVLVLLFVLSGEPASIRAAGLATLVAVPASLAQQYGLAMLQGQQRFAAFNTLRLLSAFAYAGGVVALFLIGADSIVSVVLVTMGANLAVGIITLTAGLRVAWGATAAVQPANVSAMVRFGLRGLLGSVSPIESFQLDQMVLALFLAKDALGLYVVGLAFTNLPRFVSQSVGMVAYPNIARQADATAARRSLWAFFWLTMAMAAVIVVLLWLAANRLVPLFFGGDFRDAVAVTRILLPGALFAAGRRILSDGMRGRGHAAAGALAEVVAWCWLAPALAILVPLWGVNGVAAALSGSYAASLLTLLAVAVAQGEARWRYVFPLAVRPAWPRIRTALTAPLRSIAMVVPDGATVRGTANVLAVILLALVGGGLVALVRVGADAVLVTAVTLGLVAAIALRLFQRRFDPFEPLFLFVLAWGVMLVVRPIAMLTTRSFDFLTYDLAPGFTSMLALSLVGAVGFLVGYSLPAGRSLARKVRPLPTQWHADTAVAYSIMITVIGIALFATFIVHSGGLDALRSLLEGRQPGQGELFTQSSGYFYGGLFLALPAGLLTITSGYTRHRPVLVFAGLAILMFVIVRVGTSGTRSWLLPIFGSLFVLWYLRRGRRPGVRMLLGAVAIGFFLGIVFTGNIRNVATRQEEGASRLLAESIFDPRQAWDRFVSGGDTEMASLLALEVQKVPSQIPFQHGAATGEILVHPIPRLLWEDKPRPGDEILTQQLLVAPGISAAPRQFSPIGNFYMDFGFVGAFAGMLFLGIAARAHYEYFRLNAANPAVQLVYAATLPFWMVLLRGSVTDTAGRLLFVLPPLLLGLYLARDTRRPAVRTVGVAVDQLGGSPA